MAMISRESVTYEHYVGKRFTVDWDTATTRYVTVRGTTHPFSTLDVMLTVDDLRDLYDVFGEFLRNHGGEV